MELSPEETTFIYDILTHLNYKFSEKDWKLILSLVERLGKEIVPRDEVKKEDNGPKPASSTA